MCQNAPSRCRVLVTHDPALDSGSYYDDRHSLLDILYIRNLGQIPRFFSDPTVFQQQRPMRCIGRCC